MAPQPEHAAVKSVRWMGMAVGAGIFLVGVFLALVGVLILGGGVAGLLNLVGDGKPVPGIIWGAGLMQLAFGVPCVLYGRSVFRRARTDTHVQAELVPDNRPGAPAQPGMSRGLAWTAAIFSVIFILGGIAAALGGQQSGLGGVVFIPVLAQAVRRLRQP